MDIEWRIVGAFICGVIFGIVAFVCFAVVMADEKANKNKEAKDEKKR